MDALVRDGLPRLVYEFDRGAGRPDFGVVFCHGFASVRGGEKATALRGRVRDAGLSYLAFDARGHGDSEGTLREFTFSAFLEDLDAILAGPGAAFARVVLVGASLGGAAALHRAAREDARVAGCAAIAPGLGFAQRLVAALPPEELAAWRRRGVRRVRNAWVDVELGYAFVADGLAYRTEDLAARLRAPALLLHGSEDEVVPVATTLGFAAAARSAAVETRVFPGGDHRLSAEKHVISDLIVRFAARALGVIAPPPAV